MHLFGFDRKKDYPDHLIAMIDRAIEHIEPQLKHARGYPTNYRKPVMAAFEYAHDLASKLPGPVSIDRDRYAHDPFVHAIFPTLDLVAEAFRSSQAIQAYRIRFPQSQEIYALMGMRRREKSLMGIELQGEVLQREVPQEMVYFTGHTLDYPAADETLTRAQVATSFFDRLVEHVLERVTARKLEKAAKRQELDLVLARMRTADATTLKKLQQDLSALLASVQATSLALELQNYHADFDAVLLQPEQHLHLDRIQMVLDRMGVRHESAGEHDGDTLVFNELIGYDRRNWTVVMVRSCDLQNETFAERLEMASRTLLF